jgi:hypothetical protein
MPTTDECCEADNLQKSCCALFSIGAKGPRINNLFKVAIIVAEASSSIRREMDLVSG